MINYLYILIITSNNSDQKYLKHRNRRMIRSWQDEKSQIDRTSRWFSTQTTFSVHSKCKFFKKVRRETTLQIGRWTVTDCARDTSHRGIAPSCPERAAGEERWSHLLRAFFPFFLHPRLIFPPHARIRMSYCHSYVSVLRNAYNSRIIDCLDKISTFLKFPTRYRFLKIA